MRYSLVIEDKYFEGLGHLALLSVLARSIAVNKCPADASYLYHSHDVNMVVISNFDLCNNSLRMYSFL